MYTMGDIAAMSPIIMEVGKTITVNRKRIAFDDIIRSQRKREASLHVHGMKALHVHGMKADLSHFQRDDIMGKKLVLQRAMP